LTGDDLWLYHRDPSLNQIGTHVTDRRHKILRTQISVGTSMLSMSFFQDIKRIWPIDHVALKTEITGDYYVNLVQKLLLTIKGKTAWNIEQRCFPPSRQ